MSTSELSIPYAAALGVFAFAYFVVYPVFVYFRDVNGKCFNLIPSLISGSVGSYPALYLIVT